VDKLSRVLDILANADKQEFATAQEYRLAQASTYANLLALEAKAEKEVNWAEKQLEAIESQIDVLNDFNERTQASFATQREQAADWRDAQLAAMDAQLQAMIGLPPEIAALITTPPVPAEPQQVILAPAIMDSYRETSQEQTAEIKGLREELAMLRKDMAAAQTATVTPLKSLDDRTRKWDLDGLPAGRDDVTVLRAA
jgi:septal ring factor EnvC (AmiA/AmiB activator)